MVRYSQIALSEAAQHFQSEAHWQSLAGGEVKADLVFHLEFNRDLDRNAQLSRLNEAFLEQRMEELDNCFPICRDLHEHTRARLHELLLICAANYANNCEYAAVGDLMFNPRLTLVHVRGCPEPVAKERHVPLSVQFGERSASSSALKKWLRDETILETRKKALIPHSYEILQKTSSISTGYLTSAHDRAVQIADLSALLCSMGLEDRLDLEAWLRGASQSDRDMVKSRLIPIDWGTFQKRGCLIDLLVYRT